MSTRLHGRLVLTTILVLTIAAEVAFTWLGWTGQHIFNPLWHPHAVYHAVQMSVCVSALSVIGIWALWHRSVEPRVAAVGVSALQVCWWGGEFVATAIPGASPSPDLTHPNTVPILGLEVYGNLLFAGLMIVLTAVGAALLVRRPRPAGTGSAGRQPETVGV